MWLTDLVETIGGFAIERERIRSGTTLGTDGSGNSPGDFPHQESGVDSDGSTLVSGRLVQGVSNGMLLAGAGALLGLVVIVGAFAFDD